jgi:hypothetical protein
MPLRLQIYLKTWFAGPLWAEGRIFGISYWFFQRPQEHTDTRKTAAIASGEVVKPISAGREQRGELIVLLRPHIIPRKATLARDPPPKYIAMPRGGDVHADKTVATARI